MGFKVHHSWGSDIYGDEASYSFNEAGLLVVHLGRAKGRLTCSPSAWTVVEEPDDDGGYLQSDRFSRK